MPIWRDRGFGMEPTHVTPPKFFVNRGQFYTVWIASLVLAFLVSAWRLVMLDDVPSWARLLSYVLIGLVVGLPLARARFRAQTR